MNQRDQLPQGISTPSPRAMTMQRAGYAGLVLLALGLFIEPRWEGLSLNVMIVVLAATALLPMINWIGSPTAGYPIYQTLLALTVPFYVLPLLSEHRALQSYSEPLLLKTALIIWLYQLALISGAHWIRHTRAAQPQRLWTRPLFAEQSMRMTSYTLALNTVWLIVNFIQTEIPLELLGTLRAVFFGVGLISAFLQARMWAAGQLGGAGSLWFYGNVIAQILLLAASLLLIQAIILFALVVLGYFTRRQRIPVVATILAFCLFTILHNGKSEMRYRYWEEGKARPGLLGLPDYYLEWLSIGLAPGTSEEVERNLSLLDRASLFHIVAYTIHMSDHTDFRLAGATYAGIPAQVFPRFLWPTKPSPNDSGKVLAIGIGLLTAQQAEHTSIGFGLIAEAYANFGWLGPPLLGVVLGALLQFLALRFRNVPLLAPGGMFQILLLCWCLNAEVTLVVWLSSLYQASVAVLVPLYTAHVIMRR